MLLIYAIDSIMKIIDIHITRKKVNKINNI